MSEELPKGWINAEIRNVCEPVSQGAPAETAMTFRYIDLGAIDNRSKQIHDVREIPTSEAPSRAKQLVRSGDVLFSNVRVYLENIALVPESIDQGVASTAFSVLRPAAGILPRYLYYYVTSKTFVREVNALARGNSPPSVQDGDVRSRVLPIAPPPEQQRIVSKIDELFSRINEGERALERVRTLVERYQQSVLKAAVTGELTRAWREQHGGQLESGEALLTRILEARRQAWEESELAKMKAKGIRPTNKTWKRKYEEPIQGEIDKETQLPHGWTWASLSQLAWSSGYGTSEKCGYQKAGLPVLRIPNIRLGRIDATDIKRSISDLDIPQSDLVGVGDLLTIRTNGSPNILGIGTVIRQEPRFDCYFASYAIRFRLVLKDELADWINFCWQTSLVRSFVDRRKATSAGQYNISQSSLFELCLPIPPATERRVIVELIAGALSKAENASLALDNESRRSAALRQAVLKAAFSGQLVSQDLTDEPAAVLLERIAAERAAAPKRVAGKKRKTKADSLRE